MIPQIDFKASDRVRAVLSGLGRTEDLRFSPDNRLLAIAAFNRKHCLILRIDIEPSPAGPRISIGDHMKLTSPGIGNIHGIDFIDNGTLAAANRNGLVAIIRLPKGELDGRHCEVAPLRQIWGSLFCELKTPGSLAVTREANGRLSLLVCNNYIHQVTKHTLGRRSLRAWRNRVLLRRGLAIPDGIAVSHDGEWIAVSSHDTHDIKIFRASASLGPETEPAGILGDVSYPHGLRFTPDGRYLLVADAGNPLLNVYDGKGGWHGTRAPCRKVTVLDGLTFARGRKNLQEGGPKGLDIDRTGEIVATTCDERPLAFFPLTAILDNRAEVAVA